MEIPTPKTEVGKKTKFIIMAGTYTNQAYPSEQCAACTL